MKIFNKTKVTLALLVAVLVAGFAFAETVQVTKTLWSEGKTFDTEEFGQIDLPGTAVKVGDKLIITYEKAGSAFQDNARAAAPMRDISRSAEVRIFVDEANEPLKTWEELTDAGTLEYTFEAAIAATSKITISARNLTITKVELETGEEVANALTNADFSQSTPLEGDLFGYGKDANGGAYGLQDVEGWSKVVVNGDNAKPEFPNSGMGGAVFAYGSTNVMRGNTKSAPAAGPNGEAGQALGFFAVWGCGGYYYQDIVLPAGKYTFMAYIYNQSGTQANTTQTGFFVNGEAKATVAINTAVGAWTLQTADFELTEKTIGQVRVGYVSTGGGSGANPMLFFDNVKIMSELDAAIEAYQAALDAANAAASEIVTGEENQTLNDAIAANSDIDMTSVEAVKAATDALKAATDAYNAAKADYQAFADAKKLVDVTAWPYAAAAKKTAVEEALAATATSAADALAKKETLLQAARAYIESNAKAEGVEGAEDKTSLITNPAAESTEGWTTTGNGSISIKKGTATAEEPWTDSEGNQTHNYFDGGNWGASAWDVTFSQNVTLAAGKYVLTAIMRASTDVTMTLFAGEEKKTATVIGSVGNVFNRGWNDTFVEFEVAADGTVNIGVQGVTNVIHNWMSFSNFRLTRIGDAGQVVDPNDYTSYIVNADLTSTDPKGFDDAGTKGIDGSGMVKVGNAAAFDFKQTILNLPAGKYKLTAQAAYRYGADEQAEYDAIQAGTTTKLVQLYATVGSKTVTQPVQNRYDGASDTDLANGSGSVTVNGKYVPNSSSAVQAWFAAGQYVNEVEFNLPADGDVTIGINRISTPESDYTVIGPWTLTRIGDAETEPEPPVVEPGTDMTSYITNPSFETGDLTGWTVGNSSDTGVKPNSNATYTTEGCDGDYLFNTWWQGIPITQTVTGLPNGTYELKALMANDAITAGDQPCLYLLANGEHSAAFSSATAGVFAEGSMQFYVTNGTATIGAIGGNADGSFNEAGYYWYKVDNFRLTFVEALPNIDDIEIPEGKMSNAAAAAITAAKEAGDVLALLAAVQAAKESIEAYAHAKTIIDGFENPADKTNVYTAEAKEAFDTFFATIQANINALKEKYEAGTLTDEEAKAAADPLVFGWHADNQFDDFLLSAWSIGESKAKDYDTPLYINGWSTEGNTDGSNFKVPFFEYWVGDGESLGANTISAELLGLEAGEYEVSAWVRVRVKNGAEAPATGISMQVNEGEAVAIAGDQVGTSQMYLQEYTATGVVAEDGVLKIKFDVAAENNVSWLSFKNVKYTKKGGTQPEPVEGILYSWESPEGTPVEYGGTIVYTNGDGERVNYPNAGYYTICLNGKKANINDETASANAGHMVITLNEAITEDCAISMDAYINKNATGKKASAYFFFETGTEFEGPVYSDEANIDETVGGQITNTVTEIPATAVGSKTIKITRGQTGTNLFITKLLIGKKDVVTGIENVTVTRSDIEGIYNLRGQRVLNPTKGLYIINGKKVIIR